MSNYRVLKNAGTGQVILPRARWCASFWCHLKGLMFRRELPADEGLLFVTGGESVVNTTIHMFFMRFSIGVAGVSHSRVLSIPNRAMDWPDRQVPREMPPWVNRCSPLSSRSRGFALQGDG